MPHVDWFDTVLVTNSPKKKTLIYNGKTTPGLFALVYTDSEALASGILNPGEVKFIGATTTHYDFSKKNICRLGQTFFRGNLSRRLNFLMQGSSDLIIEAQPTPEGFKILYAEANSRKPDQRGVLNFWRTATMPDNTPIEQTNIGEKYLRGGSRTSEGTPPVLSDGQGAVKQAMTEEARDLREACSNRRTITTVYVLIGIRHD
ncbi:hypothetical protein CAEBREN_15432 [Caenorhabditis brenneri]|uniref:Uncharacterized protein n=1 Tax=Caenorhabditis brenneri TaxID=135651 RepID=G0NCK5_CAEBE|nr:hypothetical protein CAEBREN_15432 [Caenorhabditis brenneri]